MGVAVRRERVILDVTDNATKKFARVAAAAKLLAGALDDLDGGATGAGEGLGGLGDETEGLGKKTERTKKQTKEFTLEMAVAAEKAARLKKELRDQARAQLDAAKGVQEVAEKSRESGREIDRLSGRLRLLAEAGVVLGPALVPLGAATIPLLTGALAGLGAAAGGIGVAVLAFQGLGDAIKSIDEYRLEPTAANLAKVRAEAERLGPAGAEFARFIANLEPELRGLQMSARNGLFPGLEDGIESILTRGPQVNAIVTDIARGMGDLARDAGASLGGEDFDAFFEYLETDARPILESFSRSVGNVVLGLANLLVGFAPATSDFTGGLERMTKSFANWSKGLEDNQGFQDFVAYVRQSGPQAVQFIGAIAKAISGLLQAAAPLGNAVLPALTGLARVFGTIASSPIGPGLYTAVAAFLALNRAGDVASRTMDRFKASADKTTSSFSKFAALGAGVLGVASAVGALADNINRIDSENLDRSLTALGQGDVTETVSKVVDSLEELSASRNKVDLAQGLKFLTLGLSGDTSLEKFADNVNQVDQSLAQMVESGRAEEAADLFTRITTLAGGQGVSAEETAKRFDAYSLALKNAEGAAAQADGGFTGLLDTLVATAGAARDLTGVLAALNGWFDKRDAVRAYKDSIDTLRESMKDGFSREDAANIDNIGRSILQVAENIKNPEAQANFLAGARDQLADLANNSGPRAAAAIQDVIDKFDQKGLTNPPPIKLSADDKAAEAAFARSRRAVSNLSKQRAEPKVGADTGEFDSKNNDVNVKLRRTGDSKATPKVSVDAGNSLGLLGTIREAINNLRDRELYITTHYQTIGNKPKAPTPGSPRAGAPRAAAGRVHADAVTDQLGPGFITPRTGDLVEASAVYAANALNQVAKSSDKLNERFDRLQKRVERLRSARDAAIGRRDELSSNIQSGLAADPWADQERSGNIWAAGATAGGSATPASALAALQDSTARARRLMAALSTLKQKGITGPVLAEIIGTGDVERAEMMAALDIGTLTQFSSAFTENQQALAAVGLAGGNAVEGEAIKSTQAKFDAMVKELKEVKQAIKQADKNNGKGHDRNADRVAAGVNSAASGGRRRGNGGRR